MVLECWKGTNWIYERDELLRKKGRNEDRNDSKKLGRLCSIVYLNHFAFPNSSASIFDDVQFLCYFVTLSYCKNDSNTVEVEFYT